MDQNRRVAEPAEGGMMKAGLIGVSLMLTLALAPAALGAAQGKWSQVTVGGEQSSISNVGVVRTGDGTLHVV